MAACSILETPQVGKFLVKNNDGCHFDLIRIVQNTKTFIDILITKFETYYITLIAVRSISMALFNILFIYLN